MSEPTQQPIAAPDGFAFDEAAGLWSAPNPSHGPDAEGIHRFARLTSTRDNAAYLLEAAHAGRLAELPVGRVLAGLRRHQCRDGSVHHGNFHWHAEAGRVVDTNAAFFVGQSLCTLRIRYAGQLTGEPLAALDDLCVHLLRWFEHAVPERSFYYPNKYLGDLVCGWLLHEITGRTPPPELVQTLRDAAAFWRDTHWGWGEHLSDIYAGVIFHQLVALLTLAKELPAGLRAEYTGLFHSIIRLDHAFAGGPRVPDLRSYAFGGRTPPRDVYVGWAERVRASEAAGRDDFFSDCRVLLDAAPAPAADGGGGGARAFSTPCFGGAVATTWIAPHARLGSMSRFPIMPGTEHQAWGLSWQTFPVAFADGETGWGFLRWRTREDGVDRAHPSLPSRKVQLSAASSPPPVGRTTSRQRGGRVVAVREMPAVSHRWDSLTDAVELLGMSPEEAVEGATPDGGRRLRLVIDGRVWRFGHHPLASGTAATWHLDGGGGRWEARWSSEDLRATERAGRTAHLWWIASGDGPDPVVTTRALRADGLPGRCERAWSIAWPGAGGDAAAWRLGVDLDAADDVLTDASASPA